MHGSTRGFSGELCCGVFRPVGKTIEEILEVFGVRGIAGKFLVFLRGKDVGVIGNINSRAGRFMGLSGAFIGDDLVGEGGGSIRQGLAMVFDDFGDSEARRCVTADCFVGTVINGGRSAFGRGGIEADDL